MKPHTFETIPHTQLTRPGILVRRAPLGRIDGSELELLGAAPDCAGDENSIIYGIATASQIAAVESKLGAKLDEAFDAGTLIECKIGTFVTGLHSQHSRLVGVAKLDQPEYVQRTHRGMYAYGAGGEEIEGAENWKRFHEQRAAGKKALVDRFREAHSSALLLRQRWDANRMSHKKDLVSWFPAFALDCLRRSDAYQDLPSAPAGFVAPTPPAAPNWDDAGKDYISTSPGVFRRLRPEERKSPAPEPQSEPGEVAVPHGTGGNVISKFLSAVGLA